MARPLKFNFNWEDIGKLITYHCTQAEIAAFYNTSVDTLERYCRDELRMSFADFRAQYKLVGKTRLRKAMLDNVEQARNGWAAAGAFLWRIYMPEDFATDPLPLTNDVVAIGNGHLNFVEFCSNAGYFSPYPKQEEMRAFGIDRKETRILLGARGYGKTDYVTIMGVAYDLYLAFKLGMPLDQHTNLIITKSKSRNTAIMEEIEHSLTKAGVLLDKANAAVIRVQGLVGKDHSVEAITIKTSMRGRHPKRIVMDDPVTDEDVSPAMRKTVKKKYDEAYKLCENIVIIGQPAHFEDLYALLRNKILTLEVPYGQIPELDADLDAMKLAGVDETSIEMSYHLKIPKSGASIFSNIKFIDKIPAGETVAFVDPSDGGDYTAITIFKGYMAGIAIKGKLYKKAWFHCLDELAQLCVDHDIRRLCFETNKHGEYPLDIIRNAFKNAGLRTGVVGQYSENNKHSDITAAGSYSHMIHLSTDSDSEYTKQVTGYEAGIDHDDGPDSLARGLIWLGLLKKKIKKEQSV